LCTITSRTLANQINYIVGEHGQWDSNSSARGVKADRFPRVSSRFFTRKIDRASPSLAALSRAGAAAKLSVANL
jgi:hypothetical protein